MNGGLLDIRRSEVASQAEARVKRTTVNLNAIAGDWRIVVRMRLRRFEEVACTMIGKMGSVRRFLVLYTINACLVHNRWE